MAAPSLVDAATGANDLTGAFRATGVGMSEVAENFFIVQIVQDGTGTDPAFDLGNVANQNFKSLGGTSEDLTFIGSFTGGSMKQHLFCGRFEETGTDFIAWFTAPGEDVFIRVYQFADVNTGSTLAAVMEQNGTTTPATSSGTSTTISDAGVITTGSDRLALNFVGVNDDNAVDAFTGMTGGTWAEAVAEYASADGTDACVQLQTATMASAGTIVGGSYTMAASDGWGVVGFALIGTTAAGPAASLVYDPQPLRHLRAR